MSDLPIGTAERTLHTFKTPSTVEGIKPEAGALLDARRDLHVNCTLSELALKDQFHLRRRAEEALDACFAREPGTVRLQVGLGPLVAGQQLAVTGAPDRSKLAGGVAARGSLERLDGTHIARQLSIEGSIGALFAREGEATTTDIAASVTARGSLTVYHGPSAQSNDIRIMRSDSYLGLGFHALAKWQQLGSEKKITLSAPGFSYISARNPDREAYIGLAVTLLRHDFHKTKPLVGLAGGLKLGHLGRFRADVFGSFTGMPSASASCTNLDGIRYWDATCEGAVEATKDALHWVTNGTLRSSLDLSPRGSAHRFDLALDLNRNATRISPRNGVGTSLRTTSAMLSLTYHYARQ